MQGSILSNMRLYSLRLTFMGKMWVELCFHVVLIGWYWLLKCEGSAFKLLFIISGLVLICYV